MLKILYRERLEQNFRASQTCPHESDLSIETAMRAAMRGRDSTFSYCRAISELSVQLTTYTMGNRAFVECNFLCRGLKGGHSVKSYFAEYRTRQRYTLGKEGFAECQALGKARHSAKALFAECKALGKPWSSAKSGVR